MHTRYGQSPWIAADAPDAARFTPAARRARGRRGHRRRRPDRHAPRRWRARTAGLKPVVLEADRVGQGWPGHSSGLLLPDPGPLFRDVGARARAARRPSSCSRPGGAARSTPRRSCGGWACAAGSSLATACWWRRQDEEKELLREYDAREAAGVSVAWLTRRQVTAVTPLDVPAAMRARDAFVFDPYRACLGLARAASARGATLLRAHGREEGPRRAQARRDRHCRRRRDARARSIVATGRGHGGVPAAAASLQGARDLRRAHRADARGDAQAGRRPRA